VSELPVLDRIALRHLRIDLALNNRLGTRPAWGGPLLYLHLPRCCLAEIHVILRRIDEAAIATGALRERARILVLWVGAGVDLAIPLRPHPQNLARLWIRALARRERRRELAPGCRFVLLTSADSAKLATGAGLTTVKALRTLPGIAPLVEGPSLRELLSVRDHPRLFTALGGPAACVTDLLEAEPATLRQLGLKAPKQPVPALSSYRRGGHVT
jgi:hypothetical protein